MEMNTEHWNIEYNKPMFIGYWVKCFVDTGNHTQIVKYLSGGSSF